MQDHSRATSARQCLRVIFRGILRGILRIPGGLAHRIQAYWAQEQQLAGVIAGYRSAEYGTDPEPQNVETKGKGM